MPSILLTRPRKSAERIAGRLNQRGYDTVLEPLLRIVPTDAPLLDVPNLKGVMITSSNALSVLESRKDEVSRLLSLPCFCVGPHTAKEAEAFGFEDVQSTMGDSATLAGFVAHHLRPGPLLHIAGRDVDTKGDKILHHAGFTVVPWIVYGAKTTQSLSPSTIQLFKHQKLDAVLVFSVRTAEALKALLAQHALHACCERLIAIGLSEAVVGVLQSLSWRRLVVASVPTEDAMMARLEEVLPIS